MRDYLASRPVARRARGHRPRDRLRRRDGLRAARRPRLERPRRRARGAGAGARGRRHVRDVPALPGPRRATTPSAWAPWPSARRRCATPTSARRLWAALRAGDVDLVATDHSPAPAALKEGDDFFAVWGGIAGAQTLLALLYDEGVVGPRPGAATRWPSCSPRRRRGASAWRRPRARSRSGADADVALVDPAATWTVAREELLDRHRLSPFVGPHAARPRGAHDPARAHDRARRADRRRALRARGAARRLGLCAVSALDDAIAELARFNDDPEAGGITREVYTPTYADRARVGRRAHARRGPRDAPRRRGQPLRPLGGQRARRAGRHHRLARRHDAQRRGLRRRARRARRHRGRARPARARRGSAALDRRRRLGRRGAALRHRAAWAAARPPASSSAPTSTGSSIATGRAWPRR